MPYVGKKPADIIATAVDTTTGKFSGAVTLNDGDAGSVTANTVGDELVIESSGAGGLSILTPDASDAQVLLGGPGTNAGAILRWNDNANLVSLGTNNTGGTLALKVGGFSDALTIDASANATVAGTLGVTGAVTANAGVVVDNITIDGTEIDLSSGDLTIDVAGDITLDAGGGNIILQEDGVSFGELTDNSGGDFDIKCPTNNSDIRFKGVDGGSTVTALRLDMSDAGTAVFNNGIKVGDGHPNNIGQVKSTSSVSLADDASITIQQATAGSQVVCIYETSQGAWAIYAVGYGVSSILAEYAVGTTDFVVGDTDGKACIITSGHTTTFKNRRGVTSSYRISSMGVGDFKG